MLTRIATYKKKNKYIFLKNKFILKPHLNTFIEVLVAPSQYIKGSWLKTGYRNVLSDCYIGSPVRHLGDMSAGGRCRRRTVKWATDSSRIILILNIPTSLIIFLKKKKNA